MKIPLNTGIDQELTGRAAQMKMLKHDLAACQRGDNDARDRIIRAFVPLLTSLARKRATDTATINKYMEAAKQGLINAIKQYKTSVDAEKFQMLALDAIEASMNMSDKPKGWFASLFGGGK